VVDADEPIDTVVVDSSSLLAIRRKPAESTRCHHETARHRNAPETAMTPTATLISTPAAAPERSVSERLRARSRATGALVMSGFGALWAAGGVLLSGYPAWAWIVVASPLLAFVLHSVQGLRATPRVTAPLAADLAERQRRAGRIFAWTSVAEGLGIFLAVNVVVNLGYPQWQMAAAMAVVGLHFLPLARAFGYRPHVVTGVVMTAWALAYPWLSPAGALAPVGPFGAAAILLASAAWALRPAH
jgi:hypothetical protein